MNLFLRLAFLFSIGCVLGWCLEVVFRRFISKNNPERRWINPGFLIGPYLPLYGTGLSALYIMASIDVSFITNVIIQKTVVFIIMAIAMTLIEFITGIIFIRHLKVKLWDYSDEWGNVLGVICPKFSLAWALIGAAYYFLVHPYILEALDWLARNQAFSFVIGFFFGVFIIDIGYSFNIVGKVKRYAKENDIIVRYDEFKADISQNLRREKQAGKFIFIFGTVQPLTEQLKIYKEKLEKVQGINIKEKLGKNIQEYIVNKEEKEKLKEETTKDEH